MGSGSVGGAVQAAFEVGDEGAAAAALGPLGNDILALAANNTTGEAEMNRVARNMASTAVRRLDGGMSRSQVLRSLQQDMSDAT